MSSAYNALIGQTALNHLTAVVFTPHLCMKFSTPEGIATVKGDQKLVRRCYNESLNLKGDCRGKEANTIELGRTRAREELRPQPKVYLVSRPVQQKRRKLGPEESQAVEEQVHALLEAGFIREVKYPLWLANIVLVKKSNEKWICTDYTDLNKACPKDPYLLPNINTLVDTSSGYK
ncbi:uncharacterized protein LOC107620674 [Arachis ipaensis]|uniref:uncharacterized protein LOC107620674 n=1 Tax=Arachis ipaensis TaxID=130454 RepID=UPI0007AEFC0D|nr:uncharacterized protein LOC107620674 [Arachis ipaensis]XP_025685200.1 uncharacterized protein LOC112785992 [Arachis hypogaea]